MESVGGMIPIIFEKTETDFDNNGLGRLRDCISCVVTEERNSVYEAEFQYPVTGTNYDLIELGRVIGVTHDDTDDIEPFDIVSFTKPINGVVTFHCVHISYRQSYLTVTGSNINSVSDAFTLLGNAQPSNPFSYWTDITSSGYMAAADGTPRTVRQMLGGIEGSILDTYGGEYEWDKFSVKLWKNRGQERDFTVRYGVNMLTYDDEVDSQGTYSSCIPYYKSGDSVVVGNRVTSDNVTVSGRGECVPLDLTDKFESQPSTAQLEAMAASIMNSKNTSSPAQTIKVSFLRLQDMDEYSGFENLLQCRLCDTIKVVFSDYGTQGQVKIVKTVWNVLMDRFDSMELGTLSTTLSEALGLDSFGSSNGGGNVDLTGVEKRTLIYTNSAPTSPMSAATLVNSGAHLYDFIEVVFKTAHVYDGYQSVRTPYIEGGHITLCAPAGSTGEFSGTVLNAVRTITMSSGALSAQDAATMGTGGTSVNSNMCIPYKIYGITTIS